MKHKAHPEPRSFDITQIATPSAMVLAIVVASAATFLLDAAINHGPGSPLPANANANTPAHQRTPSAPAHRAPYAVPTRNITQAEATL